MMNRKEFKSLLTEWNQNFINELKMSNVEKYKLGNTTDFPPVFPPLSPPKKRPEKPDGFPIGHMIKFREWLTNKLINLSKSNNIVSFSNLKEVLSEALKELSRNPSSEEEDASLVFNTFIEYKEGNNDLGGETGKEFLNHVGFKEDENCLEDNFVYIIVSPFQGSLLSLTLSSYNNSYAENDIEELKKFFVGEFFPGFDLDVAYASTHSEIEKDYEDYKENKKVSYFKLHDAECFRFKNK